MPQIFHPLLALIASSTNNELAKHVEYLKEENKILRARISGQIHTKPAERERLLKLVKVIGRAIEELMTIVSPATFYRWVRDESNGKPKPKNLKGGQRKPREIRTLVIEIAKATGFGYTKVNSQCLPLRLLPVASMRQLASGCFGFGVVSSVG
jgi:putative transposase